MELLIIISSIFRRYDFVLEQSDKPVCTSALRMWRVRANRCYSLTRVKVSLGNLQNAKLASSAGIFFSGC
jgi:hypothetical protein